jgi:hypothetical protein
VSCVECSLGVSCLSELFVWVSLDFLPHSSSTSSSCSFIVAVFRISFGAFSFSISWDMLARLISPCISICAWTVITWVSFLCFLGR